MKLDNRFKKNIIYYLLGAIIALQVIHLIVMEVRFNRIYSLDSSIVTVEGQQIPFNQILGVIIQNQKNIYQKL